MPRRSPTAAGASPARGQKASKRAGLAEDVASLNRELALLRKIADAAREANERLERLATFPEENPNPVIEIDLAGRTTYLNPVAQAHFPDLWKLGLAHPLMQSLPPPRKARASGNRRHIVREIRIDDAVYEQKVCYMSAPGPPHMRVYVHDVTRLVRAEQTNQELIKRLVHSQEEERERVSRELHDEAGQALTALKLSLELIQNEIPQALSAARENLSEAIDLTEATKEEIRILARGLRPPALDAVGLSLTLESFCRDFSRRTQLQIHYRGRDVRELSDIANMCLYRTLQEALANVARHAHATRVDVRLERGAARVRLVVEDNGVGLATGQRHGTAKSASGIGLVGMRERLNLIGGGLKVEAGRKAGVRLTAEVPIGEAP